MEWQPLLFFFDLFKLGLGDEARNIRLVKLSAVRVLRPEAHHSFDIRCI
jgi:hypothetical protein